MRKNNLKKFRDGSRNEETSGNGEQKQVRTVIIVIACCAVLSLLYMFLPKIGNLGEREEETEGYYFYPVYLDQNIYADKEYMALDRNWYYEDPGYGTVISFDENTLSDIPDDVKIPVSLIVEYIELARDGEWQELNSLFSEKYTEQGFSLKNEFTAQKIYEPKISYYSDDTVTEDEGTWDRWYFWVEYKIYENNGTFRNDMGSDCTRKELFEICYRDGVAEIDGVTPYRES